MMRCVSEKRDVGGKNKKGTERMGDNVIFRGKNSAL